MTHPYSIFIWQSLGKTWIEPVHVDTQEYALYLANLIHRDSKAVIKVVRYGLIITAFLNLETVERIEKYLEKHGYDQRDRL